MAHFKKHIHGLLGSLLFIGFGTALLLLLGFTTPLPLPEEEGILLDFTSSGSSGNTSENSDADNSSNNSSDASERVLNDISDNPFIPGNNIHESDVNPNQNMLDNLFNNAFDYDNSNSDNNSNNNDNPGINGDNNGPDSGYGELQGSRGFTRVDPESSDNMFGIVVLEITVDEKGNVSDVSLVSTTCDQCVKAAIDAVKKWKYEALPGSGYQIGKVSIDFRQR
ncbi:MAG: hypothetical protein C0596_06045 [Marinilabiliales bacterium]|nr:MAG: hypothetical protein C0596_06045 [Marinilabiliales bacterium]